MDVEISRKQCNETSIYENCACIFFLTVKYVLPCCKKLLFFYGLRKMLFLKSLKILSWGLESP